MSLLRRIKSSWVGVNVAAALLGYLAAGLGWFLQGGATLLPQQWPQVGISLVVAHVTKGRAWLGIWLVMATTFDWIFTGWEENPYNSLLRILFGATMALQILLGASLLRRADGESNPLSTQQGVRRLFLLAGLFAAVVGALIRLPFSTLLGVNTESLGFLVAYRFSSHVAGTMVMAPLAFSIWYGPKPSFKPHRLVEAWVIISLLLVVTAVASTKIVFQLGTYREVLILLILPLTLWSALRLGTWGAVVSIFSASLFPLFGTFRGMSPFGEPAGINAEIILQTFLVVTSVTTLTVAAMLNEKSVTAKELRAAKSNLEVRVLERTRELRNERDFSSSVFDAIGALIIVTTEDLRIVSFNKAFQEYLGVNFDEVKGKTSIEIGAIRKEDVSEVLARFEHLPSIGENIMIGARGEERMYRWTNTRLVSYPETFIISVGIDVTEERRAQAEAHEAIQARDDFLSVASHELKTPLTTLQLQVQVLERLIRREESLSPAIVSRAKSLSKQTSRLGALVDELLDVSRVMHGRIDLDRAEVDLCAVLKEVLRRYELEIQQSGSELTVIVPDRPIHGYVDEVRVDQIMANLLSNAIKYGAGKPIDVRLLQVDGMAELTVIDRGIGISDEDQKRIFDRFERAVSTRHYGGFGLGLWITRQVVEAHGGRISVQSVLNEGSTFQVDLPLQQEEAVTLSNA